MKMMMNGRDATPFERRNANEKFEFRKRLIGSVVLTMLIVAMVTGFHHPATSSPGHKSNHLVLKTEKGNPTAREEPKEINTNFFDEFGTTPSDRIDLPHHVAPDIFGGKQVASSAAYPYYVVIYHMEHLGVGPICGGIIFKLDLVLTAAHCLQKDNNAPAYEYAPNFVIFAGFDGVVYSYSNPAIDNMGPNVQRRYGEYLAKHNGFNWIGFGNDIGMIKLDNPFTLVAGRVEEARLAQKSMPYPVGLQVTLTGTGPYGRAPPPPGSAPGTLGDKLYPAHLLEGTATVTTYAVCKREYGGALDDNRDFCVHGPNNGICVGDSGSPIIDPLSGRVIGITTRGLPACDQVDYGVGIFIPRYAKWISTTKDQIRAGRCKGGTTVVQEDE